MRPAPFRAVAFTDFHGNHDAFEKAKGLVRSGGWRCVIVAGDIANYDAERAKRQLTELAQPDAPLFFVPGNMDAPELSSWAGTEFVRPLHGNSATIAGVFLIGLGGSPTGPFSTPFEIEDETATKLMNQAMAGFRGMPLILVSHSPPRNTRLDMVRSGDHVGSISVRNFVEKFKPTLVISGHVHEARGIDSVGETTLVNTGPALAGNYAEIQLDDKVTVNLGSFP